MSSSARSWIAKARRVTGSSLRMNLESSRTWDLRVVRGCHWKKLRGAFPNNYFGGWWRGSLLVLRRRELRCPFRHQSGHLVRGRKVDRLNLGVPDLHVFDLA